MVVVVRTDQHVSEAHDHCGSHANDHGDRSDGFSALCDPRVSLSRMFAINEGHPLNASGTGDDISRLLRSGK